MRIEQNYFHGPLTRRDVLTGGLLGLGVLAAAALSSVRSETTTGTEESGPIPQRVPEPVEVQEVVVFGTPSPQELNLSGE